MGKHKSAGISPGKDLWLELPARAKIFSKTDLAEGSIQHDRPFVPVRERQRTKPKRQQSAFSYHLLSPKYLSLARVLVQGVRARELSAVSFEAEVSFHARVYNLA
jgi:hypothetical protein